MRLFSKFHIKNSETSQLKKLERPGIMNKVRLYIGEDRFNIYFRIYDIPLLCSGKKKTDTYTQHGFHELTFADEV